MRNLMVVFAVSLAFVSVGIGQQTIEDLKPGPVTIDLGWGYAVSFKLPEIESNYDIEINETTTSSDFSGVGTITEYVVSINSANSDEQLVRINLGIPTISVDRFYLTMEISNHKPEGREGRLHLLRTIADSIRVSGPGI